jgi:RimJ/RimL family protein N-acetyltransferase
MIAARIQAQLRHSAHLNFEAVAVPPFTLFFNPDDDSPYANYAIPDGPVGGEIRAPLAELQSLFRARRRTARFEFIEACAPELAAGLRANGFIEEARFQLMICTPESYRPVPEVPGLAVSILAGDAPLGQVQEFVSMLHHAFDPGAPEAITEVEAAQYRRRYGSTQMIVARLDDKVVGGGSLMPPYQGLAEIAGIGTLEAFRRRGVASAVTAYAARAAFEQGLDLVFLTAANEQAGRVYERAGFRPHGVALAYIEQS